MRSGRKVNKRKKLGLFVIDSKRWDKCKAIFFCCSFAPSSADAIRNWSDYYDKNETRQRTHKKRIQPVDEW